MRAPLSSDIVATCRGSVLVQDSTDWPRITVVVPIRNEEHFIAQTIRYVLEQDYPADRLEILVIDGESTDRTVEIVRSIASADSRVKLFSNPRRLSSAARAIGVSKATGDVITFVDGHVYIDNPDILKNTVKLLDEKQVAVLSRPQFLETPENTAFQQAVALARGSVIGHGLDSTIFEKGEGYVNPSSSGATYRRDVFMAVGNFDSRFDACEDVEFNHRVARAGFRSYTSMRLAVYYYPRNTISGLFRQMKRYGMGRYRLARKHRDTLNLGTLIPFAFVFGLLALAGLGFLWSPLWLVGASLFGAYLALTIGGSAVLAARNGWKYFLLLPPVFWTIHTGLGWGFGVELVRTLVGRTVRFDE